MPLMLADCLAAQPSARFMPRSAAQLVTRLVMACVHASSVKVVAAGPQAIPGYVVEGLGYRRVARYSASYAMPVWAIMGKSLRNQKANLGAAEQHSDIPNTSTSAAYGDSCVDRYGTDVGKAWCRTDLLLSGLFQRAHGAGRMRTLGEFAEQRMVLGAVKQHRGTHAHCVVARVSLV